MREKNSNLCRTVLLISISAIIYLSVYTVRNILGAVSPQMLDEKAISVIAAGRLSSIYFITYAFGQLVNGFVGERVKARFMLCGGLTMAGIALTLFVLLHQNTAALYASYAVLGFSLSMIYCPLVKTNAENLSKTNAMRASLALALASAGGAPIAGILASGFHWDFAFFIGAACLLLCGISSFAIFGKMEKKGLIQYGQYEHKKSDGDVSRVLIHHGIAKMLLVSGVTGIVRTSVIFWLPTFFNQYLGYSDKESALLFTAATTIIAFEPILSVRVFHLLGNNIDRAIRCFMIASASAFLITCLLKPSFISVGTIAFAIMTSNAASTMVWVCYCPMLRDTGLTSTATGILDFFSYFAGAIASSVFANAVESVGWKPLLMIWMFIMTFGILVSIPKTHIGKEKTV